MPEAHALETTQLAKFDSKQEKKKFSTFRTFPFALGSCTEHRSWEELPQGLGFLAGEFLSLPRSLAPPGAS